MRKRARIFRKFSRANILGVKEEGGQFLGKDKESRWKKAGLPPRKCTDCPTFTRNFIHLLPTMDYPDPVSPTADPDMARLDALAHLLDSQFRIPGTNLRFGLDGIIGLIPYLGDMAGFVISGLLMRLMVRRGAGPGIMLRMLGNFVLDAVVGIIPLVGDLFDFGYKANRRNVNLLKKYYAEDKARPSAKWSLTLLGIIFFALFVLLIWAIWKLAALLLGSVWTALHQ